MMQSTFYNIFLEFWTAFFPSTIITDYEGIFVLISMISVFVFLLTIINLIKSVFKVFTK